MNTYSASILIDPKRWDELHQVRAQQLLIYKIAKETETDVDDVARRVTFEECDDPAGGRVLIARLPSESMRLIVPI